MLSENYIAVLSNKHTAPVGNFEYTKLMPYRPCFAN